MRHNQVAAGWVALTSLLLTCGLAAAAQDHPAPLKQGDSVTLDGHRFTVTKLDSLPYVQSEYTRRFRFDSYSNPKLKELREKYHLDEVVAELHRSAKERPDIFAP